MTARSWTLRLVYPKLPLSLNDRAHWAEVARAKRNLRDRVRYATRAQKIPRLDRIHVQMHWTPAVKRTRDEDNCMLTQKVAVDGLRDYGPTNETRPDGSASSRTTTRSTCSGHRRSSTTRTSA